MPRKRKRKSSEQLNQIASARKTKSESSKDPEDPDKNEFSFMKDEGGRPQKKKKKEYWQSLGS